MKRYRKEKTKDIVVSHFQKRCRQRVGVVLTQSFLKERLMFPGQRCERQSNTRTKFHLDRKTRDELGISSDFISLKRIFIGSRDFIDWHLPWAVATMPQIEKHFNLDKIEVAVLDSCIDYKLLKQYVVFTKDHQEAYIVFRVADVRKLVNLRRRNMSG